MLYKQSTSSLHASWTLTSGWLQIGFGWMRRRLDWCGSTQLRCLTGSHACTDIPVLGTHVVVSESERDLGVLIARKLSLVAHVTAICRARYNQLSQLRPVIRSSSVQLQPRRLPSRSFHVAWTTATHCCTASMMDYFAACSLYRMPLHGWSSALVRVTTSYHCYGNCTGFQSVKESRSRSWGLCTRH